MAKKLKGDQVLTGQLLREGDVVFYTQDGNWSADLQDAKVASSLEEIAEFETVIAQAEKETQVVDVYPFVIERDEAGKIVPSHIREKVRTKGPSIDYIGA
jgi:hypothetical protein